MKTHIKKTLLFSLIIFLAIPAFTQEKIKWYSFEEAYNLNKKKQKKIFVDVHRLVRLVQENGRHHLHKPGDRQVHE